MSRFVAVAVLLLLSGSRDAIAQGARPWIAVSAAYNTYAMDEVNNGIESLNEGIAPASMDEIHSALGFGASAGIDFSRFTLGVAYERLPATSDVATASTDWESTWSRTRSADGLRSGPRRSAPSARASAWAGASRWCPGSSDGRIAFPSCGRRIPGFPPPVRP